MPWAKSSNWVFGLTIKPQFGITRDQLRNYLQKEHNIQTRTFFCPMNMQPALDAPFLSKSVSCPVAKNLWETGLYLPSSIELTESQIQFIVESIFNSTRN